jgi:hypothetical protein
MTERPAKKVRLAAWALKKIDVSLNALRKEEARLRAKK